MTNHTLKHVVDIFYARVIEVQVLSFGVSPLVGEEEADAVLEISKALAQATNMTGELLRRIEEKGA